MLQTASGAVKLGDVAPLAGAVPDILPLLRQMVMIRRFEEKVGQLYGLGEIGGFCRLSIGQEAIASGIRQGMQPGESLLAAPTAFGHLLAAGLPAEQLFRDLMGRSGGLSEGKSGPAPLLDPNRHVLSGLGAATPSFAAGYALAGKNARQARVTWCVLCDDTATKSDLPDVLRIASDERLAMVVLVESCTLETDAVIDTSKGLSEAVRAVVPEGIAAERVDGVDISAVRKAAIEAAARARTRQKPHVIELSTYRYRGHSLVDAETNRTPEALRQRRERCDPIERAKAALLLSGQTSAADLQVMDREIRGQMAAAVVTARMSPEPPPETLTMDVVA